MSDVSVFRLNLLRVFYAVLFFGLGTFIWPEVVHHDATFAVTHGVRFSLLAGMGLMAGLGLRYPLQMVPLLLFELCWKAIYLIAFALPLYLAHGIDAATAEDIRGVVMVIVFISMCAVAVSVCELCDEAEGAVAWDAARLGWCGTDRTIGADGLEVVLPTSWNPARSKPTWVDAYTFCVYVGFVDVTSYLDGQLFIWSSIKAQTNVVQHGITFELAREAFFDPFVVYDDATANDELRQGIIGRMS